MLDFLGDEVEHLHAADDAIGQGRAVRRDDRRVVLARNARRIFARLHGAGVVRAVGAGLRGGGRG
jgi:hypothetical protein